MRKKIFVCLALAVFFCIFNAIGQYVIIDVKTEAYGGRRSPVNTVAIWIQTQDGKYINTIEAWSPNAFHMLKKWREASGLGEFTYFDGLTSATRNNHDAVLSTVWDCKDTGDNFVEAGVYEFWVDMSEDDYYWKVDEVYLGKTTNGVIELDLNNDKKIVTINGTTTDEFSKLTARYFPKGTDIYTIASLSGSQKKLSIRTDIFSDRVHFVLNKLSAKKRSIDIYSVRGNHIRNLSFMSNTKSITWNKRNSSGKKISSGVYLIRMSMGENRKQEMVIPVSLY